MVDSFIEDYPATPSDEAQTRLMLRSFPTVNRAVVRSWLNGEVSRAEAPRLPADTLDAPIATVAPEFNNTRPN